MAQYFVNFESEFEIEESENEHGKNRPSSALKPIESRLKTKIWRSKNAR